MAEPHLPVHTVVGKLRPALKNDSKAWLSTACKGRVLGKPEEGALTKPKTQNATPGACMEG